MITVAERDEQGRPTSFHMEQEAEWDDEQIALLLAVDEARADVGPHGIPMSEAASPLNDPNDRWRGGHYETRVRIDHAQRALNLAQAERREAHPDEDSGSLLWSLHWVEESLAARARPIGDPPR